MGLIFPSWSRLGLRIFLRSTPSIQLIKSLHMTNEPKEVEILDIEEIVEEDFYQFSQEFISNNTIYINMDLQFNELLIK